MAFPVLRGFNMSKSFVFPKAEELSHGHNRVLREVQKESRNAKPRRFPDETWDENRQGNLPGLRNQSEPNGRHAVSRADGLPLGV